jgi:hypothetical protein
MADPWAFGWDALVAIGTLSLAAVTFALVVATRRLATQGDAEIRAQWRPVLLVRDRVEVEGVFGNDGVSLHDSRLTVWVENVGRGPAFGVDAQILQLPRPGPGYGVPRGWDAPAGGMSTQVSTAMAPGDLIPFVWHGVDETLEVPQGEFNYGDMSRARASSYFELEVSRERARPPKLRSQAANIDRPRFGP